MYDCFVCVVPPRGKAVKRTSHSTDNRLASTSYDQNAAAGSENDEDADTDELRNNRDEFEESVRTGGIMNRKRRGIILWYFVSLQADATMAIVVA